MEDLTRTLHLLLKSLLGAGESLTRVQVPCSYEQLLKLKHVVDDVLVLLEECVFVLSFLKLVELSPECLKCGLLSNLELFDLLGCLYELPKTLFDLIVG